MSDLQNPSPIQNGHELTQEDVNRLQEVKKRSQISGAINLAAASSSIHVSSIQTQPDRAVAVAPRVAVEEDRGVISSLIDGFSKIRLSMFTTAVEEKHYDDLVLVVYQSNTYQSRTRFDYQPSNKKFGMTPQMFETHLYTLLSMFAFTYLDYDELILRTIVTQGIHEAIQVLKQDRGIRANIARLGKEMRMILRRVQQYTYDKRVSAELPPFEEILLS
jgi:hypothetical protein